MCRILSDLFFFILSKSAVAGGMLCFHGAFRFALLFVLVGFLLVVSAFACSGGKFSVCCSS